MNNTVLRILAAQHQPTDKDLLEFGARIKSEHYFASISDALNAIDACINDKINSILDEDSPRIWLEHNPVLKMNIIDESVCSIIYHIFISHCNNNTDEIVYFRDTIEEYLPKLMKYHKDNNITDEDKIIITQLHQVLFNLSQSAFPDNISEEATFGQLAVDYYCLMYFICFSIKPRQKYFTDLGKFYVNRVNEYKRRHGNG